MKKQLLFGITMSVSVFAFAQNTSTLPSGVKPPKINPAAAHLAKPYDKNQMLGGNSFETIVNSLQPNTHQNQAKSFTQVNVGTTQYQLQTNSSICNRMVKSPDGTISATWTMAQDPGWADRGTGYNYYNGTAWGALPTVRLESVRTGFTNIGVTSTNQEIVVCHEAPSGGGFGNIHVDSRPTKGTGTWTESALGFSDVWARMSVGGSNGQSIHVISSSGNGSGSALITYHGQTGAITYSRSLDGGVTWDKLRTIIPCLDSSHYVGFGGDAYAIDAKGDTIVIVAGGFDVDVVIAKSIDNGNTWTSTVVKRFPIPMYEATTMVTDTNDPVNGTVYDTIESNDASVEVLLDNNGMAHVWYGKMMVLDDVLASAMSYFPSTQGLMYWNESMASNAPVMISAVVDINGDGILNVDFDNTAGGLLGMGTYQVSLTSHPSAGIDASGKLYLAYSGIFEGTNNQGVPVPGAGSSSPGKSYRHTYLMRSDDGGGNWCPPIDITDPDIQSGNFDYIEGVYGAMAKDVDGFVHIIVQDDATPGHGVSTATNPDPQTGPADINYYKVPVEDLACGAGVHDKSSAFNAINLYPNPANSSVSIKFNVNKTSKTVVKIYNVMGQEVANFDNQAIANGTILTVNLTNYQSGIYFVNTVVDGKSYSQKLIVE